MTLAVELRKNLGGFQLNIQFESSARKIGILGASGCGKSMTLKSIAGIERPDEGKIIFQDKILYNSEQKINIKPQKRNVGYLFQNYALFPTMAVSKNIEAGLKGKKSENQRRVKEMLKKFQLEELAERLPGQLSGGQQQRVALARIMAYEPDMILLDEPFSALDVFLKDRLQQELIEMLQDYEGIVIMVSHSRDEIYRFSEEVMIIENGTVAEYGKTKDIFANPIKIETAKLTGCKNFSNIRKINSHTVEALDWGIVLHTKSPVPEQAVCIGCRAHDFEPVWGESEENCLKVKVKSVAEMPFEKNYYLYPEGKLAEERKTICWFVQYEKQEILKTKGMPDWLKIKEDKLMFLEK